jgi:sugar phosphate isomerase/epimerase
MIPYGSISEKARLLKSWGFDGISIFLNYGEWNNALREEVLRLSDMTGIEVCEFAFEGYEHGHGCLMDNDTEIKKRARAMYFEAGKICAQLSAVTEIEFEYRAQSPLPMLYPYKKMPKDREIEFLEMYGEMAQTMKGTSSYLLLEPINRYESPYLNCIADALEIVKKLDMPNTGILADIFHMSIEERSITESLKNAAGYILHVHIGDNNRLLPGYGNIDWAECISTLKDIGYDRYINLECCTCGAPENSLPKTVKFLRNLLDG